MFAPTQIKTYRSSTRKTNQTPTTKPSDPSIGSSRGSSDEKGLLSGDSNTPRIEFIHQESVNQEIKLDQVITENINQIIKDPILAKDDTFKEISEQFHKTSQELN